MKNYILFFIALLFVNLKVYAQASCPDKFDEIDISCIQKYESKFKKMTLPIGKDDSKIQYMTFFYKTTNGLYGKFVIRSTYLSKNECSVFLDATTFQGDKVLKPNSTLSIANEFNSWGKQSLGFDETSINDFSLSVENGRCVLKSEGAVAKLYKKTNEEKIIQGNDLLYMAGAFLIGLAVFLIARTVFQDEDRFKAQEKLEDADQEEEVEETKDIILKYSRPFFKRYFSPVVMGMKNKKKIKDKYRRKLASAGMTKQLTPEDFFAFKLFLILGFPIVYLALRSFLEVEQDWPLSATPLVSLFGYVYPDIWIKGKIDARRKEIISSMPFVVDMLALSVEAGLDFVAAMQKVIEKAPKSALVDEFETMIKDTKIGASRAEALRQMGWRIDALPVSSFCATLIAADSVGASIGPILKTLSGELRQKRSATAEKLGAQAATKLLFPMIFLVLPAVAIVIAAPIALEFLGGGG